MEALKHDYSHITHTYTALAVLKMLGDDLSRVNRPAIMQSVRTLQNKDGSFNCLASGSESDMRFVYCAACICYLLNDWSGMDVELTAQYIASCQVRTGHSVPPLFFQTRFNPRLSFCRITMVPWVKLLDRKAMGAELIVLLRPCN